MILGGTEHKMPSDLQKALTANKSALHAWNDITSLARNEWLCWVESAKLIETRKRRVERAQAELAEGKRRPCCWMGCIHRSDKPMSQSQKYITKKQSKKS